MAAWSARLAGELVAVDAAGHQAILDSAAMREVMNQHQADHDQDEQHRDRGKPASLPIGDGLLGFTVDRAICPGIALLHPDAVLSQHRYNAEAHVVCKHNRAWAVLAFRRARGVRAA